MPIIVPIEDNKVGLATATDAKFRAPDYSGSGLEALGAGLVQLGGGGQQLASGIEERRRRAAEAIAAAMLDDRHQGNIDDAAVKKAYVDYSDGSHEALHGDDGLLKQQGAVAHAAFPGLVEKLVDNHDKSLSKLDEVQRAVVAPAMNERLRSDVARAADYVRQQGMAEQKRQSEQLQKAAARDAANHADDPELFDHHIATGENAIRQQAKIDGLSDKVLAKQIADYRSGVPADAIDAPAQSSPAPAADRHDRFGVTMAGQDQRMAERTLGPALMRAGAPAAIAGFDSKAPGYIPASFSDDAITPRMTAASFDTGVIAPDNLEVGDVSNIFSIASGQSDFTHRAHSADGRGTGAPTGRLLSGANSNSSDEHPPVAAGDGGAPEAIHIDMHPSHKLWAWLGTAAGADQYVIDSPPDFITRFRRASPEFVRREKAVFAASKNTEPPLEHALLVYQSLRDRHIFTTRTVVAKDQHGLKFHDFETGRELPFGRLPELKGFKLVIAEHTHPRPWYDPFRHTTARQGPTNLDVIVSKFYPSVHFIINAVHTNDFMDGSSDESYYFGPGDQ